MEMPNLGLTEIIIILLVFVLVFGVPLVVIVAVVLFFKRRKKSHAGMKKCAFCGYWIQIEASVCQFCGREVGQ